MVYKIQVNFCLILMFLVILRLGLDFIVMYLYVFVYYSLILMERIFCFSYIFIGLYGFYNYRFYIEYNLIVELNVLILFSEMIIIKYYGRLILINYIRCNFVCIFYNKGNEIGIIVCVILLKF